MSSFYTSDHLKCTKLVDIKKYLFKIKTYIQTNRTSDTYIYTVYYLFIWRGSVKESSPGPSHLTYKLQIIQIPKHKQIGKARCAYHIYDDQQRIRRACA